MSGSKLPPPQVLNLGPLPRKIAQALHHIRRAVSIEPHRNAQLRLVLQHVLDKTFSQAIAELAPYEDGALVISETNFS